MTVHSTSLASADRVKQIKQDGQNAIPMSQSTSGLCQPDYHVLGDHRFRSGS